MQLYLYFNYLITLKFLQVQLLANVGKQFQITHENTVFLHVFNLFL